MSILINTTKILNNLGIYVGNDIVSGITPDSYAVITLLVDAYELLTNDHQHYTQEIRISLYSKGSYVELLKSVQTALQDSNYTITSHQYIGHEDDTGYHHYVIDAVDLGSN